MESGIQCGSLGRGFCAVDNCGANLCQDLL